MADYKRQTAKKCRIGHLLKGNHVKQEGWDPNYVETPVGKVSRVNIMAIVVSKEPSALTIDDGSGKISLRSFGEVPLENFDVGDKVLVIARPRVYNEDLYLAAEVVRSIENDKWLEYRKKEIELLPKVEVKHKEKPQKVETEEMKERTEKSSKQLRAGEEIVERIKRLDDGKGADVDKVIEDLDNGEKVLDNLMEEGEIFELKPGKVKVLE